MSRSQGRVMRNGPGIETFSKMHSVKGKEKKGATTLRATDNSSLGKLP